MCGIIGIYNYNNTPVDHSLLKKMADELVHRGPDDEGYFINSLDKRLESPKWKYSGGPGNIGLGHRRLSIIDLSTGHQPMSNEDGTIWVSFNGEIYNFANTKAVLTDRGHVFQTNSDTEVIVHAYEEWGRDCVKYFRGMFAFAIWDGNKRSLLLARDRLGKKPLYYYSDDKRIVFSSEIKSILKCEFVKREINEEALFDYLSLLYIPGPKSIFRGIYKLDPGHTLLAENGNITISKYWDLKFENNTKLAEDEWCYRIIDKLRESTEIRLISDVPLGAFLSGGVDSSAIVGLMSKIKKDPVLTTSIGFDDEEFNELSFAREIAQYNKSDHYEMIIHADAVDILNKLVWYFDEPFADSSAIPTYYVSKIAREKVTVSLSGDGGDENFAGYRRYFYDRLENGIRKIINPYVRKYIIGTIAEIYPKADWLPQIFRAKTLLTNISLDHVEGFYNTMSWFREFNTKILNPDVRKKIEGYSPRTLFHKYYNDVDTSDPLTKAQYIDIKTYLVDDILVKVDRASMANSLEVRAPILDHEFMELVASIPSSLKLNGNKYKYIFKKAFKVVQK